MINFLKILFLLLSLIVFFPEQTKASKIIDSKTGSINNINLELCVYYFYDDHPEKMGLAVNTIYLPLRIGLSPLTMLTENGLGMDHSSGFFLNDSVSPSEDKIVILKNLSFGTNTNQVAKVFSIRKYNSDNGSEIINITRGKTHSNKFFIVKDGINKINYEIVNDKSNRVLKEGTFNLNINSFKSRECIESSSY